MKKLSAVSLALMFVSGSVAALAQGGSVMPPPKVLVIQREYVKPGKDGAHEKSEMKFVHAWAAAKWPTRYVALTSQSGRPRALFLIGYASFEAMEKDTQALDKAGLLQSMDPIISADGDLLTDFTQSIYSYDAEHSLRAEDAVHARYFEITQFFVKPGHVGEFLELSKMYRDAMEKASPNFNWALYRSEYGENNGGLFIAISLTKSLAEDDKGDEDYKSFMKTMGPEGMKKIADMTASCLASSQTNLFKIDPAISYPAPEWVSADPFWKATAPAAPKKAAQ